MTQFKINRQITIQNLIELGYPALPVAPKQDSFKYPLLDKKGSIVYEKDGVTPKPKFTGKNPSYLDAQGELQILNHGNYQNRLPSASDLKKWFIHPDTGIGTLGGFKGSVWIDFDAKDFDNQSDCDTQFQAWLEKSPQLKKAWIEQTHSGGYRVLVCCKDKSDFTNFALTAGGKHRGEALGEGRFTVLAPTIGVSGNPYRLLTERVEPIEVESLESIGIYPFSKSKVKTTDKVSMKNKNVGAISLKDLSSKNTYAVLQGLDVSSDRSESLTLAIKEWYGWENWLSENGVTVHGTTQDLAYESGLLLGVDEDRINRILATINAENCIPASNYLGGDKACWARVRKLNENVYRAACPQKVQAEINADSIYNDPAKTESKILNNFVKRSVILEDLEEFDPEILKTELAKISQHKNAWQFISKRFSAKIEENINYFSSRTGIKPEVYALAFLTAVSSVLNGKFQVQCLANTQWYEPLNIFYVIVGEPGTNKSSVPKLMIDYHRNKNQEYRNINAEAKKQYKFDLEEWTLNKKDKVAVGEEQPEQPVLRFASIGQATMEYLIQVMESQRNIFNTGLLQYQDELITLLGALNKYNGGGDEVGRLLEIFSAAEVTTNTKTNGSIGTDRGALSILSTTQPTTWLDIMTKLSKHNGLEERFLVSEVLEIDAKELDHFDESEPPHNFSDLIKEYVDQFDQIEAGQTIKVNKSANHLKQAIEKWYKSDAATLAKPKSYIYRLAGIFAAMRNPQNPEIVAEDLDAGWKLVCYSQACKKSIGGLGQKTLGEELIEKARQLFIKKGELSVSNLKQSNRTTFGNLAKEELFGIIHSVHSSFSDTSELTTTKQGSPKLIQIEAKTVSKLEKDLNRTVQPKPVTPTVEPIVDVPAQKVEIKQIDKPVETEVECIKTEEKTTVATVEGMIHVPTDKLAPKFRPFATTDNQYRVVTEDNAYYSIEIIGVDKLVKVNKSILK